MDTHPSKVMHACSSTLDRISNLPTNVIENILSSLPLREAAKTSILSTTWRNKWRYIPHLVFDDAFCQLSQNHKEVNTYKLCLDIFQILALHRGPITRFTFCSDKLTSCPQVDQVMLFLREKPIQEFTFSIKSYRNFQLPSYLFSYQHLQQLSLSSCVLKAPPTTFGGFRRLTHLRFERVRFDCNVQESFISKCPVLEHLAICDCTDIECFVINFPNIKSLVFSSRAQYFSLEINPLLVSIVITPDFIPSVDLEESSSLIEFFECLPTLERICMNYQFLSSLTNADMLNRPPTAVPCLKVLELLQISFRSEVEVSWVLYLVTSCPNLVKLKIEVYEEEGILEPEAVRLFEAQDLSNVALKQLREVKIGNFGDMAEIEFVKFLLSKSVVLEKLVIKPVDSRAKELLILVKKLLQLPRLSPKAEIIV